MSESKKFWRLELDFDGIPQNEVVKDAEQLIEMFPALNKVYHVEDSKSGGDHFHVIFPLSKFNSFEEAYDVALKSRADKDWLDLCQEYQCFGLETEGSRRYNVIRQQREKKRVVNKPSRMITSPFMLDLVPASSLDARRIVKVCEAIKDSTWEYTSFINVIEMRTHIQIGCVDEAQALRRMKWLSDQTLGFAATIKKNTRQ